MTTKPKVRKFRIRRSSSLLAGDAAAPPARPAASPASTAPLRLEGARAPQATAPAAEARPGAAPDAARAALPDSLPPDDLEAIRQEGLTGRQLRMARRAALKHGLTVTSDFDAVHQLREIGVDPFSRSNVFELVVAPKAGAPEARPAATPRPAEGAVHLPQTVPEGPRNLPSTERASPAERRASEIMKIQRDLARRRRRRTGLLITRLAMFVLLPTLLAGWYFYRMATPMYATVSEFVIQQAEPAGAAGLGGLFQGTSMATQQDSITVQSYLTSRAALVRLNEEEGFASAFQAPGIDPLQRLPEDASTEAAYDVYQDHVRISYDPTEGIVKMEVIAPDPALSQQWSEALIGYAEEQVDQLTQRLREDQMAGALVSYEAAEARRADALAEWLAIQEEVQQIDPVGETAARTQQISALETERQQLMLSLQERLSVARPQQAQVESLQNQIASIETLIANLRQQMTEDTSGGASLAAKNTELRLAEEDYTFQTLLVQQALTQMETARVEANRQVRYLSLGVEPVAPDEATYPRAFENTLLSFLVFAGIYLMLSLTASILREQVTA